MFSFLACLFYVVRRSRHCAYCGELSIKSQMLREPHGRYFCDAECKASTSMERVW